MSRLVFFTRLLNRVAFLLSVTASQDNKWAPALASARVHPEN
jgi:hypothetical protein